ncbi:MAG TPA: nicotinamide riboside transporter PnuC [Pyrinomonadaceae bacterium]|jgi:nicotinamide mononucleotide transporter|nr:nicotinamide riboside transporter PnuC [Pyrinomonadaceae bacterium]
MKRPDFWKRADFWIGLAISLALLAASWRGWLAVNLTETFGFVTGAACVYLTVVENVWNFPLGIANNVFFLVLFAGARLYGDAGLQVLYIALGFQGWYLWLRGGENHTALRVSRATPRLLVAVCAFVLACTALLTFVFIRTHDSAPFLDALTTALSLAAQYLLNRKAIENWLVWMAADVIYVYLYLSRGLYLTGVLYFVFLCMCVAGLTVWLRALRRGEAGNVARAAGGEVTRG